MNDADLAAIAALPGLAFAAVLLIARIGCALMVLPGFGEAELPMTVRAGLAVALAALIGPPVAANFPAVPADVGATVGLVGGEVLVGLWLGWLTRLLMMVLPIAGQMIASVIGLANVLQPDPTLGPQTSVLACLFALAAVPAMFASGLYALPLSALAGSYRVFQPGHMLPSGDAAEVVIAGVGASFALALQLGAPFVLASTLWHVGLAVLGRLIPNLQVYFVASPGQILGGLLLLGLLGTSLLGVWQEHVAAAMALLPGL